MKYHSEKNEPYYLSSVPYFPVTYRNTSWYKLQVFADVAVVRRLHPPTLKPNWKSKQKIRTFSDKSRKNMIMFLAKIEDTPDLFVTLTYSDDVVENAYLNMHAHFEAFRKRLERAYTGIRAMWRIEFQTRKSGRFKGEIKPHFHLLVWLPKWLTDAQRSAILENDGEKWRTGWHEICGSKDKEHLRYYGCQVLAVRNRRHAYSYASKYMAKDDIELVDCGRRWGRIGEFEQNIELDTELTLQAYIELKRLLNAYIKRKSPKFYKSFRRMNIRTGCSVFGLGYISQAGGISKSTILAMVRHARELATDKLLGARSEKIKVNSEAQ